MHVKQFVLSTAALRLSDRSPVPTELEALGRGQISEAITVLVNGSVTN